MVNEGVAVMLPVVVDFVVTLDFLIINRVACVPSSQVGLHPRLDVPLVNACLIAALPLVAVGHAEVEVCASKVSLEVVRNLEALADGLI